MTLDANTETLIFQRGALIGKGCLLEGQVVNRMIMI